jgi:hypothetical protein
MRGWAALRDAGREAGHGEGSGSPERSVAATEKAVHHQAETCIEFEISFLIYFSSLFSFRPFKFSVLRL